MKASYEVRPGPEHFLPPAAASMRVRLPDPGQAILYGRLVSQETAFEEAARRFLLAEVPTIFPGPLVLWAWNEAAAQKARAVRHLYETIKSCVMPHQRAMLIPMPDYRPKYPKINPEVEINPNHPNLTIWHNRIDVGLFVGVHCHQANLTLKIVRGGPLAIRWLSVLRPAMKMPCCRSGILRRIPFTGWPRRCGACIERGSQKREMGSDDRTTPGRQTPGTPSGIGFILCRLFVSGISIRIFL